MNSFGIRKGIDLKKMEKPWLINNFGKAGTRFYNIARAVNERKVNPNKIRKSVGVERTLKLFIKQVKNY